MKKAGAKAPADFFAKGDDKLKKVWYNKLSELLNGCFDDN